jgi:hypothetical protein
MIISTLKGLQSAGIFLQHPVAIFSGSQVPSSNGKRPAIFPRNQATRSDTIWPYFIENPEPPATAFLVPIIVGSWLNWWGLPSRIAQIDLPLPKKTPQKHS